MKQKVTRIFINTCIAVFFYTCASQGENTVVEESTHAHHSHAHHASATSEQQYAIRIETTPTDIAMMQAGNLQLTPIMLNKNLDKTTLSTVHEKKMHIIIVSEDLSDFQHVHPLELQDSSFLLNIIPPKELLRAVPHEHEVMFHSGGKHILFADYTPTGAGMQLDRHEIEIQGEKAPAQALSVHYSHLSSRFLSFLTQQTFQAQCGNLLEFSIFTQKNEQKETAVNPNDLDFYLGEKAHIVAIDATGQDFVHAHPTVEGGKIVANAHFRWPGLYKIWLQFQKDGQLSVQDFVIEVQPAAQENAYICPMNCEKKSYACPGICPVCKMELVATTVKK